jgi:hypothetical protein
MNLRQRGVIGGLLLVHGVAAYWLNFLWEEWTPDFGVIAAMGIGVAQVNLIALWGALSPGPVVQRLPWALLMTVLQWYVMVLGGLPRAEAPLLGVVLLMGMMCALAPLWLARRWQRWRLAPNEQAIASDAGRFHLREALAGATLLCIALACVKMVIRPESVTFHLRDVLLLLLIMGLVANLITALPTVWLMLRLRPLLAVPLLVLGMPLYAFVIAAIETVVFRFVIRRGGTDVLFLFQQLNMIEFWTIGATLLALRWGGFRLARCEPFDSTIKAEALL